MSTNKILCQSMAQKQNIERFQAWMRKNGATYARASVDPRSHNFRMGIEGEQTQGWDDTQILQFSFGPENAVEAEQSMNPLEALREIVRFTVTTDQFVQNVAWLTGATISLPPRGPMSIESHQVELRAPHADVH